VERPVLDAARLTGGGSLILHALEVDDRRIDDRRRTITSLHRNSVIPVEGGVLAIALKGVGSGETRTAAAAAAGQTLIVDGVAAAEHGLRGQLIGEAETRSEVRPVGRVEALFAVAAGALSGEDKRAWTTVRTR